MMNRSLARPAVALAWRVLAAALAFALTAAVLVSVSPRADAADADDFDPGYIIDDSRFFTSGDMTVQDIQDFLDDKGPTNCTNCLRVYRASTYDRPAETGRCPNALVGKANVSAAQMIYDVAQACEIAPEVLLVTLQKEQSLVTRSAPSSGTYSRAMGYGCPDTAPCDTSYYGLFIQLYSAASQLNWYSNPAGSFNWYPVGSASNLRFHPRSSCGTSRVVIQNRATAALYYYTPYQPNAAALNNLYGTGDSCSSYGNRNFFIYYTDWFGNPQTVLNPAPTTSALDSSTVGPSPSTSEHTSNSGSGSESPDPTPTSTSSASPSDSTSADGDTTTSIEYVQHRVAKGDTVWDLSIEYRSSVREIITRNSLSTSALIRVGQVLDIPVTVSSSGGSSSDGDSQPSPSPTQTSPSPTPTQTQTSLATESSTYRVVAGDSLWRIANKFGVSVNAIVEANGIKNPSLIRVGQVLTIPGAGGSSSTGSSSSNSGAESFVTHKVVAGDTVSQIAKKYGSTTAAIVEANDLKSANLIFPGQRLRVPTA